MNGKYEVDVTLICYNHGRYLRKCLDSILCQRTNFKYRIIIGDDCSSDDSQAIIREYADKYPEIIVPILNRENIGASKNAFQVAAACTADFVCGGESDDYWTDEMRLQKQYDFLKTHPDCVGVGCNYYNVDANGENPYKALLKWQVDKTYTLNDFLRLGFIVHGNTIMYRNIFPINDARYVKLRSCVNTMGDVISRVVLYDNGNIYCLPDIMHAHRMGSQDKASFFVQSKSDPIKYCYLYNKIVDALNEYFDNKYDLTPLLAGRAGLVIFWNILGINKYDKNEFQKYMNTLPLKTRIYAYYRAAFRAWRSFIHVVGRKLGF